MSSNHKKDNHKLIKWQQEFKSHEMKCITMGEQIGDHKERREEMVDKLSDLAMRENLMEFKIQELEQNWKKQKLSQNIVRSNIQDVLQIDSCKRPRSCTRASV